MQRFTVKVEAATLNTEARALRSALETGAATEYLVHARRLYDWLVRPLDQALKRNRVDTLVFVPDGALRLIPLAVLHDGKQFLIERYAVATSPALALTDRCRATRPCRRCARSWTPSAACSAAKLSRTRIL